MELRRGRLFAILRVHNLCAIAALLSAGAPALAQSVEVSPLRVELAMNKGASYTQAVTLSNQGSDPVRIRARLQDWFIAKDGTPQFDSPPPEAERAFVATSWVRMAPPEQVVQPGQQAIVRFTTTAPADAADAGYRAAILFEFAPANADPLASRRAVQFRSRVATLVYMNVGHVSPAIELSDLASRHRPNEAPTIVATLRNSGRANVRTKGTVTLRDAGGQAVRTVDVPNVPVLPLAEREIAIATTPQGQAALPPGVYRVELKIDAGMPELVVGETTMTIR